MIVLLQSHIFKTVFTHKPVAQLFPLEVIFLESETKMSKSKSRPKPEMTSEGKYRCRFDNQEYDTKEDYDAHCMEEHESETETYETENKM